MNERSMTGRNTLALLAAVLLGGTASFPAWADGVDAPADDQATAQPAPAGADDTADKPTELYAVHFEGTTIVQGHPSFHSPYRGAESLSPKNDSRETITLNPDFGYRPWAGAEAYFDPEWDQGFGLDRATGLAGFPNGDSQKGGFHTPKFNVARLFISQTFGFGGEQEYIDPDMHQLGGWKDVDRLTITGGKFSIPDFFDNNAYSHGARTQFLNWALMDGGAFDYAGDLKGYTEGLVIELNQKNWAVRGAYTLEDEHPNDHNMDPRFTKKFGSVLEFEGRYKLYDQAGTVRVTPFLNRAYTGDFREAVARPDGDITKTLRDRWEYGYILNLEQAVTDDLGVFARYSWNDGKTQIMSFTDISTSYSAGLSLKGTRWGRPDDTVGVAGVIDRISNAERAFLANGGLGILVGDGQLPRYKDENIVESYYSYKVIQPVDLSLDYQLFTNPAYNPDRGPVHVLSARVHVKF